MPTIEETRTEWKALKSAIGNVICYIDGHFAKLGELDNAYQKGREDAFEDAYKLGLEEAWDIAKRIVTMSISDRANVFFYGAEAVTHDEPFKSYTVHEAIQALKEHDSAVYRVTHSNAQKFVEVFGFAPGYEILNDGREVYPSLNDEFWNAEYKEPKDEERE